jgi:hypothetical protein
MSSATTHHGRTRLSARRAAALAVVALVVSAAHAASARAQAADPCAGAVGGLVPRPATAFVGQPVTWCFPPAGGAPITNYLWDLDGVAGYEHTTTVPQVQVVYDHPGTIRAAVGTNAAIGFVLMALGEVTIVTHNPKAASVRREGSLLAYRGSGVDDEVTIAPNDDRAEVPAAVPLLNIEPALPAALGAIEAGPGCEALGPGPDAGLVQCLAAGITDIQLLAGDGDDTGRVATIAHTTMVLRGGAGKDALSVIGAGELTAPPAIYGEDGDDKLSLSNHGGTVVGGAGDDEMGWAFQPRSVAVHSDGGPGNDRLSASDNRSADRVQGGAGDDIIRVRDTRPGAAADAVSCGPGIDTVDLDRGKDRAAADCENQIHSNAENTVLSLLAHVTAALAAHGLPAGGLALHTVHLPSGGRLRLTLATAAGRTLATATKRVKLSGAYELWLKPTARARRYRGPARLTLAFSPRGGHPVRFVAAAAVRR